MEYLYAWTAQLYIAVSVFTSALSGGTLAGDIIKETLYILVIDFMVVGEASFSYSSLSSMIVGFVLTFLFGLRRSTTLDSWNQDQLKLMSLGGNGRAHTFFKQHGWTDGGRIEAKYTSRAADLYRQLLAKEVAKSMHAATSVVSPKVANEASQEKDFFAEEVEAKALPAPAPTPAPRPAPVLSTPSVRPSSITRKPTSSLGAKKVGAVKSGGLGVRKLTTKVRNVEMSDVK